MSLDPIYCDLLDAALESEYGIRIFSANGQALRGKLYTARNTNSIYSSLRITFSPDDNNEVWIVKKKHYTPAHGRYIEEEIE